jgi:hypothetical protein
MLSSKNTFNIVSSKKTNKTHQRKVDSILIGMTLVLIIGTLNN